MSKKTAVATLMASFVAEPGSSDIKPAITSIDNEDDNEETWDTLNITDGINDVLRVDTELIAKSGCNESGSADDEAAARLDKQPTFGVAYKNERTEEITYYSKKLDHGFVFVPLGKSQDIAGADEYYCSLCQPAERCRVYVRNGVFVAVDPAVGTTPHTCVNFGKGRRGRRTGDTPSCDIGCNVKKMIVKMTPFTRLAGGSVDKQEEGAGSDHAQQPSIAAEPDAQLPEVVTLTEIINDMQDTGAHNLVDPTAEMNPAPPKKRKVIVTVRVPKAEPVDYDSDVEILDADVKPPVNPCAYSDFLRWSSPSRASTSRGTYTAASQPKRQVSMGFGRAVPSTDDPSVVLYHSTYHERTFKFREVSANRDPVSGKHRRGYQCMGCEQMKKKHELGVSLPLVKVIDSAFVDINPDRPQENEHLCVQDRWTTITA
ncbi:hypothetical protein AAVH_27773 [Aphelenchoides avenae]|nr:hypothetical protein AAVH_27773 [Aphelenchus avenae]